MYSKVIVLEIKSKYCLAMTDEGVIIRIMKKDNVKVGDRIYILDEDLYHNENKASIIIPFPTVRRKTFLKASSIAVAIILCFSIILAFPQLNTRACAAISIDAASDIQLKLNKDYKVISAVSYGNTVPEKELKKMIGQKLIDIKPELISLFGKDSEPLLIGYALQQNSHSVTEEYIKDYLDNVFPHEKAIYVKGVLNDIIVSNQRQMSIGLYLASMEILNNELEDVLDEMDLKQILDLLKKRPDLMTDENVREVLEEKRDRIYNQDDNDASDDNLNADIDDSDDSKSSDDNGSDDNQNPDTDDSKEKQNSDADDSDNKQNSDADDSDES